MIEGASFWVFFFSSRRRHTSCGRDWSSTCALPISVAKVSDDTLERLRLPRSVLKVSIPVRMDDGTLRMFPGYRVRYDSTLGPTKGGIRFHPRVNVEIGRASCRERG